MHDFVVSARKYRPSIFDEVIGQESITITLKEAIKNNQLAQSFLFCGPRGVGKTSCARILAKTINCNNLNNLNSCNECDSCKGFNDNSSFNIHELDAASNNSVDDIRKLVDQVRFAPQVGQYNIYIIDEVHMLSTQAFNAFLKTLEEPPRHAKFILATTEKHKIIPTILSRCQIFDFKRISTKLIVSHLENVAHKEGIAADIKALQIIAQKSDGAMRDSLSLFDRLVNSSENKITYQEVLKKLNVLDYEYYFRIVELLLLRDVSNILVIINEIFDNGFDGHNIISGLSEHLRDLLVSKDKITISLLEKGEDVQEKYLEQSQQCSIEFLLFALKLCNDCDLNYKTAHNKRLLIELTLMQIISYNGETSQKKTLRNIKKSENIILEKETNNKTDISEKETNNKTDISEKETNNKTDIPKEVKIEIKEKLESVEITPEKVVDKQSKTISINETIETSNSNSSEDDNESISLRNKEFNQKDVKSVFDKCISKFKKDGKSNLAIALGSNLPTLKENDIIEILLDNSAQLELIRETQYLILDFLKNELDNDHIRIEIQISENQKSSKPYTNKEKLNKMKESNPDLEELRISLSLDPDY